MNGSSSQARAQALRTPTAAHTTTGLPRPQLRVYEEKQAVGSTSLVYAVRSVSKTLARIHNRTAWLGGGVIYVYIYTQTRISLSLYIYIRICIK